MFKQDFFKYKIFFIFVIDTIFFHIFLKIQFVIVLTGVRYHIVLLIYKVMKVGTVTINASSDEYVRNSVQKYLLNYTSLCKIQTKMWYITNYYILHKLYSFDTDGMFTIYNVLLML